MPKITEQKKVKGQPKQEEAKVTPLKKADLEPKVVVYRVFECVVHLEVALAQLKAVGIFPGPELKAQVTKANLSDVVQRVENLYKDYLTTWGEIQK